MSKTFSELRNYLHTYSLHPNNPVVEKLVRSAAQNCQVEVNGIYMNINGYFRAKNLLDETLINADSRILKIMHCGSIYQFLLDKLYCCLQHDFDIKTEQKIKEEGFYMEAIEYWIEIIIEKINKIEGFHA